LVVQVHVLEALRGVHAGGTVRFAIDHPIPGKGILATLTLTVNPVREPDYEADDIMVELDAVAQYAGQHLLWQLTVRDLASLNPPQEGWDRYANTYSNIAEREVGQSGALSWRPMSNAMNSLSLNRVDTATTPTAVSTAGHPTTRAKTSV